MAGEGRGVSPGNPVLTIRGIRRGWSLNGIVCGPPDKQAVISAPPPSPAPPTESWIDRPEDPGMVVWNHVPGHPAPRRRSWRYSYPADLFLYFLKYFLFHTLYYPFREIRNTAAARTEPVLQVHAGSFRVSVIHRILTWTTGSLTCVRDHSYV